MNIKLYDVFIISVLKYKKFTNFYLGFLIAKKKKTTHSIKAQKMCMDNNLNDRLSQKQIEKLKKKPQIEKNK